MIHKTRALRVPVATSVLSPPTSSLLNTSEISGAELYVVSTAASGDDNRIIFNDQEWPDQLAGGSSGISIARLNVSAQIRQSGNRAGTGSVITKTKGDYMENRNLILVLAGTADGYNVARFSLQRKADL